MDNFVQKKPKLGDGNLLKTERGGKLKEVAGLSAAGYYRYSAEMLEVMVLLKKNAKFMPSVEEVVIEMKRKKQAAKDAKRAAAQAAKVLPVHSWYFDLMGDPWSLLKSLDSFFSVTYLFLTASSFDHGIVFLVTCVVFFP